MKNLHLLLVIVPLFLFNSCKKEVEEIDCTPPIEENCFFPFGDNLDDIYGYWEPKQIINLEDNDTTNFDLGDGPTGFMLHYYYHDSYELRTDSTAALYYVGSQRYCKERVDSKWYLNNDTLYFNANSFPIKVPVISLTDEELVILDTIDFKHSKATFRKVW